MEQMWNKFKFACLWAWTNPSKFFGVVFGLVIALAIWKLRTNKSATLSDVIAARRLAQEVATKEARAKEYVAMGEEKSEEAQKLRQEVAASKRRVVEIRKGVSTEGKTDEEIADLFSFSGF